MTMLRERLPHSYTQNRTPETKHGQKSIRKDVRLDLCELAQIHQAFYFCLFHMQTSFSNSKKSVRV